jgi:hypothetical protein
MDERLTAEQLLTPLDEFELNRLGTYNAEVSRGIVHREDWSRQMSLLQRRFDARGRLAPVNRYGEKYSGGYNNV